MSSKPVAVLTSGGLDSAILVVHMARFEPGSPVHPIYIRAGLAWEKTEQEYLQRFLSDVQEHWSNIQDLVCLEQPTRDLYGEHWSTTGKAVPDERTPDEAVYLPGRNLLLTIKGLLWCHLHNVKKLALGVLKSNPFPDASADFFKAVVTVVGQAVADPALEIVTPLSRLHKVEVMNLGKDLPLEWSFSCIAPRKGMHCGRCNKCAERRGAFRDAGIEDRTKYWEEGMSGSNA